MSSRLLLAVLSLILVCNFTNAKIIINNNTNNQSTIDNKVLSNELYNLYNYSQYIKPQNSFNYNQYNITNQFNSVSYDNYYVLTNQWSAHTNLNYFQGHNNLYFFDNKFQNIGSLYDNNTVNMSANFVLSYNKNNNTKFAIQSSNSILMPDKINIYFGYTQYNISRSNSLFLPESGRHNSFSINHINNHDLYKHK